MKTTTHQSPKGFTLIELLIVIAVLGVLAAVVLVAINPVEQLARTRDAGRKTVIGQLKNAVQAYYTSRNGTWPSTSTTWISTLVTTSELKQVPAPINYAITTAACAPVANNHINFCYATGTVASNPEAIVYTTLESGSEKGKCPGNVAYFVWNSAEGKAGVVCYASGTDPVPAATLTYVN